MASAESQSQLADVYRRLVATELEHAEFWAEKLRESGTDMPTPQPSWRARVLAWFASRFGPDAVAVLAD